MPTQGASITVQGGLDLISSSHALFRTPGAATVLQNFESSTTGGYRRISGYQKFGTTSAVIPSGLNTDVIHGIKGLWYESDGLMNKASVKLYTMIDEDVNDAWGTIEYNIKSFKSMCR